MAGRNAAGVELGNLRILNVTNTIANATTTTFTFTVPSGGVAELREATYHLKRASILTNVEDPFTSYDITVRTLEVVKQGTAERVNLLSGTPNIKEFGGDGKLARLFTVIETLENNEDITIDVRNDDSVSVDVSLTLVLATFPRARRIAAQPAEREDVDIDNP